MKISKELVSEVFKLNICEAYIENNVLYFDMGLPLIQSINLYEFCHKNCKEWARDKYDITISSSLYKNYAKSWNLDKDKSYTAKTEVEVIIKACEWLLRNIK